MLVRVGESRVAGSGAGGAALWCSLCSGVQSRLGQATSYMCVCVVRLAYREHRCLLAMLCSHLEQRMASLKDLCILMYLLSIT